MVEHWCSLGRLLAGINRGDPGEGFPVQHIEPLPLGGQLPASLGELLPQIGNLRLLVLKEGIKCGVQSSFLGGRRCPGSL